MKVWIVEAGEYDDRHIVNVFSTPEDAQLEALHNNGTYYEWLVDEIKLRLLEIFAGR